MAAASKKASRVGDLRESRKGRRAQTESNGVPSMKSFAASSEREPEKLRRKRGAEADVTASSDDVNDGRLDNFTISECTRIQMKELGFKQLLPVQYLSFNHVFQGHDVVCKAKTGTGKTLAFSLPLIEKHFGAKTRDSWRPNPPIKGFLKKKPGTPGLKVLAVLPTRELAQQVHETFSSLSCGRFSAQCIFGGAPEPPQEAALRRGCDILVATPGRLLAFIQSGAVTCALVESVILDEADKLLEMGFREDIESLLQQMQEQRKAAQQTASDSLDSSCQAKSRFQLLLFTATFPRWAGDVAKTFMTKDHVFVDATSRQLKPPDGEEGPSEDANGKKDNGGRIEHLALQCHWKSRGEMLPSVLCAYTAHAEALVSEREKGGSDTSSSKATPALAIIFCETKQEVNDVALNSGISKIACALHGDLSQQQREATLKSFRKGVFRVLVATDVAARGLDVSGIRLVIQMSPPRDVDTYIHRAGRTGRAGRSGVSLLFYAKTDAEFLVNIEREGRFAFRRVGLPRPAQLQADVLLGALRSIFPKVKLPSSDAATAEAAKGQEALVESLAKKLLKKLDAQDVVSALLSEVLKRKSEDGLSLPSADNHFSLLTSRSNFAAFVLKFNPPPSTPLQGSSAYVWRALKNQFASAEQQRLVEGLEYMTLLASGDGAVFDVATNKLPDWERLVLRPLEEASQAASGARKRTPGFTIEMASQLPALQDALFLARQKRDEENIPLSRHAARLNPNHVSAKRLGKDKVGSRSSMTNAGEAKRRRVT